MINLHSDIVAEFEQLTTIPWSEYAELCSREHAQSIFDEQQRSGIEPDEEEITSQTVAYNHFIYGSDYQSARIGDYA